MSEQEERYLSQKIIEIQQSYQATIDMLMEPIIRIYSISTPKIWIDEKGSHCEHQFDEATQQNINWIREEIEKLRALCEQEQEPLIDRLNYCRRYV
jgi:hypothetical protein